MKTLPLTVLVHEGPSARAYLARMRQAGLCPARILLMIQSRHPTTGKTLGRWLPGRVRAWYAEKAQRQSQNHWPRWIKTRHPHLVEAVVGGLNQVCDEPETLLAEMLSPFRYEDYAETVERVMVAGLRDPALVVALSRLSPATVLFTGGGIIPRQVLEIAGVRFLHVHPGYLPHVRGADGVLWSTLLRGRPAMSCFYMAPGIDVGHIIAARDYPAVRFDLNGTPRPDDQTLYRTLFSFYDPLLRADFLVRHVLDGQTLDGQTDLSDLPAEPQNPNAGVTYHFMHPRLRSRVLSHLFVSRPQPSQS